MKTLVISLTLFLGVVAPTFAQTAHDAFMSNKIKANTSGDVNHWVHGENDFQTTTNNDWNNWKFAYLGLEGQIHTEATDNWNVWKVANSDITITNSSGNMMIWMITGEDQTLTLSTTNWNTWALSGAVTSGISTTVTGDFSEWGINGGDWMSLSPNLRAAAIFISVFTSAELKNI